MRAGLAAIRGAALAWLVLATLACAGLLSPTRAAAATAQADHITTIDISPMAAGSLDAPAPQVDPAGLPTQWRAVTLPYQARFDPHVPKPGKVETTWFRLHLARRPSGDRTYLYIPRWDVVGHVAIYADGRLIFAPRSGPKWNSYNQPVWLELAPEGAPPPGEILIRLDYLDTSGVGLSTVWVGDEAALALRHATRQALQIDAPKLSLAVFLVVGLVTLVIWFRRRDEPAYLLIFLIAVTECIHSLEYFVGVDPIPVPDGWLQCAESLSETWNVTFIFLLATHYIPGRFRWPRIILTSTSVLLSVLTLLLINDFGSLKTIVPVIWAVLNLEGVLIVAFIWVQYFRRPTWEGLLYTVFATLGLPSGVHDILMGQLLLSVEDIYWVPLDPVIRVPLFLLIVGYRHTRALDEAVQARATLAHRLSEREAELALTYSRLRESERQQMLTAERQRLMRDMHDGVGSTLMGALAAVEGGGADEVDTAQLLRECIDDLKLTIDSLEPVESDLLLLLATVRYRLEPRFEQAGVTLDWAVEDVPALPAMTPESALHVLRMVQEIFTNVLKHARATRVRVAVGAAPGELVIVIEDNGIGFPAGDPPDGAAKGLKKRGLANLRARAAAIGAAIGWESGPGGARVELRLKL